MTFVSVAQASRRLGVDAKTLHRWLGEAHIPLHSSPHDGRKKGVSSDHLQVLARLHQRSLTPLPEVPPAPVPAEAPELSAALLALPERLAALQTQIAALQQQVADLTLLLQQQAPAPVARLRQPSRAGVPPSQLPQLPALVPLPRRPASRCMSSLVSSMAIRGTMW